MIDAIRKVVNEWNLCRDELERFEMFTPHCFPHTFATRCFEAGIQPKTVQMYLGHATLQMTMDLYISVLESHKQEKMQKLETVLDNVFGYGDCIIEKAFAKESIEKEKIIELRKMG